MMEVQVVLSSDEIIRGLKHYRRIAKQDILRAPESANPETALRHAEARREVYAALTDTAERSTPQAVVEAALVLYRELPFGNDSDDLEQVALRGRENALENFFLMIGLEPKLRREARNQRPTMARASESGRTSDL
jgi:hypothetical protein